MSMFGKYMRPKPDAGENFSYNIALVHCKVGQVASHCCRLTPASSQVSTLPFAHSPLPGTGEKLIIIKKKSKRKGKRQVDQDNNSLIRKAKAPCTSKAKRGIHWLLHFPSAGRCLATSWEAWPQYACLMAARENKHHNHEHPPFLPPFPQHHMCCYEES